MRYRLDVVAPSVRDAVENAGGWIFDRVGAGWDVTVLVANLSDSRPLRILGADVMDLHAVLAEGGQGRRPQAIAVAADVCGDDPRARRGVLDALSDGGVEVVVWGDSWLSPPEHRVDPVLHRLSVAARAFKVQALCAADVRGGAVADTEVFRSGLGALTPFCADLTPVG